MDTAAAAVCAMEAMEDLQGRYRGLRRLGIREPELHMLACCSRGAWPISGYSTLTRALPNAHFDNLGLPRLIVLHRARA